MRSVSALVLLTLLCYGACETPTNATEGECEVTETTAICREMFKFPEDVRITKLFVHSKNFTRIEKNDLTKYENLEILDVSNSAVQHIDHDAFTSNENLKEINLSGNKDIHIPSDGPFISSKTLTYLNLSHTAIGELPDNIFADLPNLEVLDLSFTSIKTFSSLSNLEHIKTLIISEDANLNKTSLCQETQLNEITEIGSDNTTTFTCPENPAEIKQPIELTTIILPTVSENTTNENETTPQPETITEAAEESNTSVLENLETKEESKPVIPEIPEIPETSETPGTPVIPVIPENGTSTNNQEPPKKTEEKEIKIDESNNETEAPKTEKAIVDEDNKATESDPDSLIVFNNINNTQKDEKSHDDIHDDGEQDNAHVKAVMPQPNSAETNGTNIVLGIILCVMIVGAIGFGYRYWKNRRGGYSNANTEDVEEGKELQNMVSHRATNGEPEQN